MDPIPLDTAMALADEYAKKLAPKNYNSMYVISKSRSWFTILEILSSRESNITAFEDLCFHEANYDWGVRRVVTRFTSQNRNNNMTLADEYAKSLAPKNANSDYWNLPFRDDWFKLLDLLATNKTTRSAFEKLCFSDIKYALCGSIGQCMVWTRTPQGHDYWQNIHNQLKKISNKQLDMTYTNARRSLNE